MSATQYIEDSLTRHQIMLQRLSGGAVKRLMPIIVELEKEIKARLTQDPTDFQLHRLQALAEDLKRL